MAKPSFGNAYKSSIPGKAVKGSTVWETERWFKKYFRKAYPGIPVPELPEIVVRAWAAGYDKCDADHERSQRDAAGVISLKGED